MNTVHTLREYVDALRDAGILVESTVSDELAAREIHCLTYDTRALSEDALFICKGAHFKEEYLCDALSRGAIAYVAEKKHNVDAPCLLVNDIRYSLVVLGQLFYNHVTDKLTSVGITGTKGKSTTAYYVRYILNDWLRAAAKREQRQHRQRGEQNTARCLFHCTFLQNQCGSEGSLYLLRRSSRRFCSRFSYFI